MADAEAEKARLERVASLEGADDPEAEPVVLEIVRPPAHSAWIPRPL